MIYRVSITGKEKYFDKSGTDKDINDFLETTDFEVFLDYIKDMSKPDYIRTAAICISIEEDKKEEQ